MKILAKIYRWIFSVPGDNTSIWSIVLWWELRRIPYNIIIGILGIISLSLFFFFVSHFICPGEDAVEQLALIAAPILINIAYTSGWIVEIILRKIFRIKKYQIGILLLKSGFIFSIAIVFYPSVYWGFIFLLWKLKGN